MSDYKRIENFDTIILDQISEEQVAARRFTTRSSAHGSDYVPLSNPERYDMTLDEAEADVRFWRAYADTVGGDAIIVECPNS